MPERCPLCDAEIVKPEGEVMHRCPNRACPSRGLETLINWVMARDGHRGRGRAVRPPALGRGPAPLDARPLPAHDGAADGARRLRARSRPRTRSTRSSRRRQQPFSRVLFGLNIPDVGWVTARNLARHFGVVDALLDASQEEILEVEGIGPDRAEAIAEWFADEENRALVDELRELGLRFEVGEEERPVEGPLTGKHLRDHRHARVVHARGGRRPRSRRSAPRSPTPSRRRRPASSWARARARSSRRRRRPACRSSPRTT